MYRRNLFLSKKMNIFAVRFDSNINPHYIIHQLKN